MENTNYHYEHIEYRISPHAHFELSQKDSSFVPLHWHNALEIIYVLEGELVVIQNQKEEHYHSGDIALVNLKVPHSTISRTGNTAILLQIPAADLYHYIPDMQFKEFFWEPFSADPDNCEKMDKIRLQLKTLLETANSRTSGYILRFESQLLELIFLLYSGFSRDITTAQFQLEQKTMDRIAQIISYTEEHYAEPLTLSEIAGHFHLQVNYFCRFFKNNTGITYMNFLKDYRIYKIYNDLINTDTPLALLLERHGFTNYKLFRQCFLERFGTTPSALRRAQKNEK